MSEPKNKPLTARMLGRVWNLLSKPETVIPSEHHPTGHELTWGKYKTIDFFTKRNQFAKDLLLLSELSPTHRSCIYTKADYEFSDGFGIATGTQTVIKTKTQSENQIVPEIVINAADLALKSVNADGESMIEVSKQVRINLNTSGNGFLELVWGEYQGQRYYRIYNHDFHKVLFVLEKKPTHVYISEDWDNEYIRLNPPVMLPLFPRSEFINGSFRSILHIKEYSIGRDFYGLPGFIASKIAGQLEYESDRHNLERFFSDFMPKFFAAFFAPDGMTDPEKDKFYEEFENTYTKRKRDGSVQAMVQVLESESMKPFFHEFGNKDSEGDFMGLRSSSSQTIFTAHRWHPVLAGIPISSGLNDAKQIQNLFSIYNKLTIKPNQNFDLDKFINPVFKMMCDWLTLDCKGYQLTLDSSSPISFFSELDINSLITVDEGRKHLGEDKIGDDRGKKLISEIQAAKKAAALPPKPQVP